MIIWLLTFLSGINTISVRSFPVVVVVNVPTERTALPLTHHTTTTTTTLLQPQRHGCRHGSTQTKISMMNDDSSSLDDGTVVQQQLGLPICVYDQITIPLKKSVLNATGNSIDPTESSVNSEAAETVPQQEIIVYDITKQIQQHLSKRCANMQCGTVTLYNRHTTTSLIINEYESRLLRDMQSTFLQFVPPDVRSYAYQKAQQMGTPFADPGRQYEHNDIHLRPESFEESMRCYENGYNISDPAILQSWRDSEPINAHSHLLSMMIGSPTLTIPVHNATLQIGIWQSIMLIDFDGPRPGRTVGMQMMGYQCSA